MTCQIDRLLRLDAVIEFKDAVYDDWTNTSTITYTPKLTTKAAIVRDSSTQKTERVEALELEYTENMHAAYIPYSDIPQGRNSYTLRIGGLRYPIVDALDVSGLHEWTELILGKAEAV